MVAVVVTECIVGNLEVVDVGYDDSCRALPFLLELDDFLVVQRGCPDLSAHPYRPARTASGPYFRLPDVMFRNDCPNMTMPPMVMARCSNWHCPDHTLHEQDFIRKNRSEQQRKRHDEREQAQASR